MALAAPPLRDVSRHSAPKTLYWSPKCRLISGLMRTFHYHYSQARPSHRVVTAAYTHLTR